MGRVHYPIRHRGALIAVNGNITEAYRLGRIAVSVIGKGLGVLVAGLLALALVIVRAAQKYERYARCGACG